MTEKKLNKLKTYSTKIENKELSTTALISLLYSWFHNFESMHDQFGPLEIAPFIIYVGLRFTYEDILDVILLKNLFGTCIATDFILLMNKNKFVLTTYLTT